MIRIFILVILFIVSASASKCIGWVGKPPKGAYCWEVSSVEQLKGKVEIIVDVYGHPQTKPNVTLDDKYARFISKKDIPNRLGFINFTRYKFQVLSDKKSLKNSWVKVKEHYKIKAQKQLD